MSLELVIFDMDGLLIDSERVWQEVWNETAHAFSLDKDGSQIFLEVLGRSGSEVEQIIADALPKQSQVSAFLKIAREKGTERLTWDLHLKPGVLELLTYVKQRNYRMAVATSTSKSLTLTRLKQLNIYEYFDYICCGDEVQHKKPAPEIYQNVLNTLQIDAENALVLEDSSVGVEAAFRCGIPCIMVPDLVPASALDKKRACHIVEHLGDVKEILANDQLNYLYMKPC